MRKKVLLHWLLVLVWLGVIFAFSAQPAVQASTIDVQDFLIKKTAHFVEYFILNSLILLAIKATTNKPLKFSQIALTFILSVLYAASDEFHQTFVPGREGRIRDVMIDTLGVSTSAWYFNRTNSG